VLTSGVVLLFAGPGARGTVFPIRKVSFFVWLAVTGPHLLIHLPGLRAPLRADYGNRARLSGSEPVRDRRMLSLAGVLIGGPS